MCMYLYTLGSKSGKEDYLFKPQVKKTSSIRMIQERANFTSTTFNSNSRSSFSNKRFFFLNEDSQSSVALSRQNSQVAGDEVILTYIYLYFNLIIFIHTKN
jgi:hypothetical protein